jgi:flagellar hook-associated protein 1 FlgK
MAVTGQNLANANNPTYSNQTLNVTTSTPLETPIGEEGTGVVGTSITSASDPYINSQIQAQNSVTSSLTAQQTGLQNAEAYLDEEITSTSSTGTPDSPNGLSTSLSNLFNSFSAMQDDPNSPSLQQSAVQSAEDLASQFQQVSSQLSGVRNELNDSIQSDVTTANQDLTTIASLNKQIVIAESSGGTANDLVDQREAALEDLSNKVNITTTTNADGSINVSIGNKAMVTDVSQTDSLGTYDASGNGQLMLEANSAPGTALNITGGSIEGSITARDGALSDLQTGLNTLASQLITNVNSIYSQGYDANGDTGQDLFTGTDASDIAVNSSLVADPSLFQYSGSSTPGSTDNSTVVALSELANQNISGLGNQTLSENYDNTVTNLGSAISSVNNQLSTSQSVGDMLTNQRDSIAGVSLDDQMTNLIQYQKAYEASAELVTTVNEMLETVVQMKTE